MRNYIVFVSKEHYNPLGIVRALGESGIKPIVVSVKGDLRMVSRSKYVKAKHIVADPEEGLSLILTKYSGTPEEKSFILTGDDVTVSVLDAHYDELKDHFYFYNAGQAGRVRKYMNKDEIGALAVKHGFKIPRTWKVKTGEIPGDLEYPVMTKAIHSFGSEWKNIVYICNNEDELKDAYSKIHSENILLQKYILKSDEQAYEGFCVNRGRDAFFSLQTNEVYSLKDKYSPFWKISNVDDKDFIEKATGMLSEIGFEGIFEFEFMVGPDGELYFLEINLRNTVLGWATAVAGMPSATLWCESMIQGKIVDGCYKKVPEGFTAMAECFDFDARVRAGLISCREWIKEYKAVNAKLYRGRNDVVPFLAFLWYKYTKMKR